MGLCQHCLCISLCVQRERGRSLTGHSCKNCTSLGMPYKCNNLTSKQKHSFSKVLFFCKHQVIVWNTVFSEHFEALRTGKDGLRWVTFSAENVGQLIPYTIYLKNLSTSILTSNKVIVWRTMAQNTWRKIMQGEETLDKISIVHWMSLTNTPILCPTSVTNCRILSQEICFRGSQYYGCSLLVNGWRHTVSLNSQMDYARLFNTLWSPWRLCWLLDDHDKWLAPKFQNKPCATNRLLVNMDAFARGQNLLWCTH